MIRKIRHEDYEDVFSLISTLDHSDDFYCGYTSNDNDQLKKELTDTIQKQAAYVAVVDGKIKGVVSYFQFNEKVNRYDISGPYVINHSVDLAFDLYQQVTKTLKVGTYQFFFRKNSSFYPKLMDKIKAECKGYEYELMLEKYNFKRLGKVTFSVAAMKEDERELVKQMHDQMFPDVYLSANQLVESKDVYVFHHDDEAIGYALIRPMQNMFYLDVFAIKEQFRHQGFGKQFLSSIIDKSFYKNTHRKIKLVVEAANEQAVQMYIDFGFSIISINSVYHVKQVI